MKKGMVGKVLIIGLIVLFVGTSAVTSMGENANSVFSRYDENIVFQSISNQPPAISNPNPENGSSNVPIKTEQLSVFIYDIDGDKFDWSITTNPDIGSNSSTYDNDGTKICPVDDLEYSTTYTWYVNATDTGGQTTEKNYTFTTQQNIPPYISNPIPADEETNVTITTEQLSVFIYDLNGDQFDWSITTNPDIGNNSETGDIDGTKICNIDGLNYSTTYTWYVNATDTGGQTTSKTYTFETEINGACYSWVDSDGWGPDTTIDFDASCSKDDDGIILYEWDWDSNGTYDCTEYDPFTSHDYADTEEHLCTLRITDSINKTDTFTDIVQANIDKKPVACYSWEDADEDGPGTVINFDANCSTDDRGITNYQWDWTNNGNYDATGKIVSHDYRDTKFHYCKLRVTDTIGQTNTIIKKVHAKINNILLTESFEDGEMPPPGGWTVDNENPDDPWMIVSKEELPQAVHSGQYAAIIWFNSSKKSDNWLVSPELDLAGYSKINLEFWMIAALINTGATIELHIVGDGFDDVIWSLVEDENWENGKYLKRTFDLTSYKGEKIKIAWRYVGKNGPTVAMDDIKVIDPEGNGNNQQQSQQQLKNIFKNTNIGMPAVSIQNFFKNSWGRCKK